LLMLVGFSLGVVLGWCILCFLILRFWFGV